MVDSANQHEPQTQPVIHGLLVEFDDVNQVVLAARAVRDAGYQRWDVHSPFPIHGIDPAMGIRPTILPWVVLVCGLVGLATGLGLTVWTMAGGSPIPTPWGDWMPYEYLISGKPLQSLPAFMPVVFEMTILLAAFGGVFGMFLLNGLPRLSHPLLAHDKMRRVTDDRFFVVIEGRDKLFDAQRTQQLFEAFAPLSMELVRDEVAEAAQLAAAQREKSSH